jgi:hypothetical protein
MDKLTAFSPGPVSFGSFPRRLQHWGGAGSHDIFWNSTGVKHWLGTAVTTGMSPWGSERQMDRGGQRRAIRLNPRFNI